MEAKKRPKGGVGYVMNNNNNQFSQENVHYPYIASASPSSDAADSGISRREFLGIAAASMFLARADQEAPPTEPRNGIPYRTLGRTRENSRSLDLVAIILANRRIHRKALA